jgi:glycosyltransferase involved in cell wall biosynthesis
VRGVVSFYSPTVHGFLSRAWRPNGRRLELKQEFVHWRSSLLKIPQEFYAAQVADAVIGNSDQIRQDVQRYYRKPAGRAFSLPAAVDYEYWAAEGEVASHTPIIFYCGRLYARKGVFDLLQACRQLAQSGLEFRLVLAGEDQLEGEQVAQAVSALGLDHHVTLLPHQPRPRIRELMQTATLFVFPSYFEGSPRAVKEAMAAGCPVVTYDIPGTRFIDPSGESLRLVPLGDLEALAQAIQELLISPAHRDALGQAGQRRMKQFFSTRVIAARLVSLYHQLFEPEA